MVFTEWLYVLWVRSKLINGSNGSKIKTNTLQIILHFISETVWSSLYLQLTVRSNVITQNLTSFINAYL